jgi:hypothetical protein
MSRQTSDECATWVSTELSRTFRIASKHGCFPISRRASEGLAEHLSSSRTKPQRPPSEVFHKSWVSPPNHGREIVRRLVLTQPPIIRRRTKCHGRPFTAVGGRPWIALGTLRIIIYVVLNRRPGREEWLSGFSSGDGHIPGYLVCLAFDLSSSIFAVAIIL